MGSSAARRCFRLRPAGCILGLLLAGTGPSTPLAAAEQDEPPATAEEDDRVGLQIGLDAATAYIFNGSNYFMVHSPQDQNALLAPYVVWRPAGGPLAVGYRSAYQIAGDQIGELIDLGWGAEQDFWLSYRLTLREALTLETVAYTFFYPFADPDKAGATVPFYLMPYVTLTWDGPLTLALDTVYVYGIQHATRAYRYLYFKPSVFHQVQLVSWAALELGGGVGYKVFHDWARSDGRWDAEACVGMALSLGNAVSATPTINLSWLNKDAFDFDQEYVLWGGLNVNASF